MENELAATQPEQTTAAPVTTESAPVTTETQTETPPPVEQPKTQDQEPEWFTKRFGEITAKYRETERRAIAAEQQLAQYRQEQEARKEPEKTKTLADFDYDEGRFQAYVIEQAREAARAAAREAEGERKCQESAARRTRKFQEREVAFEKTAKDYREVAHYAPISNTNAEIIQDMDNGPEIAYWLGKNRDVALSLNDLPPHIAAIELGRIDERLNAERKAKAAALEAAKAAKAVTKAPDPASTLDGSGEPGNVKPDEADSDKLSDAEWTRRRNKQVAKQRR
jgi:hypothetical protein